jgi:virginiamycin A acetyltransferase
VVTRDVAPYTIVAGVPARPIRSRFPQEQVAELLTLKWWEWPEAELLSIVDLLNGADVEDLIAYGRRRSTQAVPAASHQGYGSPPQSR